MAPKLIANRLYYHSDEVEPDEKGGYHLKFDARVDGAYPHLVSREEVAFDTSKFRFILIITRNSEAYSFDPFIALEKV